MNDFIRLRNSYSNPDDLNLFSSIYLEEVKESQSLSPQDEELIEKLEDVFQLHQKSQLTQTDMIRLLGYVGTNLYVNNYVTALFIKNQTLFATEKFKEEFVKRFKETTLEDEAVYALLDSCIECGCDLIDKALLFDLLKSEALSLDTFSLMIDYIHCFGLEGFEEAIYFWLGQDYPLTIKIQLIDLLIELYSVEKVKKSPLTEIPFSLSELQATENYIKQLEAQTKPTDTGMTILQSMFYGDFENSGKGNNGGLAVFLKNLGNELSKSENIEKVITLTVTHKWTDTQSLISRYSEKHIFARVPLYLDPANPTEFLKKEYLIKRTVKRFLERFKLQPDVYHVRFLDNASKAMAGLSKEQAKKLVVTLTPDPHRNMTDQTGELETFSFNETLEKINKIKIGDELISASDKIVGIGNHSVKKELGKYFPQLLTTANQGKLQMISEGIQMSLAVMKKEDGALTDRQLEKMGFTKEFLERPIILNVGRLNKLKAQDQLLKAWGNSELSDIYHLLIIGGDLHQPTSEEQEMMEIFENYLKEKPALRGKFLHLGALSNYQIRKLEKRIRNAQKTYPQLYLCSSKKEEFGMAILEAMSQRFLVLGPEKGGVKSYLENGVNGFLIDTTNWESIAKAAVNIVLPLKNQEKTFEKIQAAGKQKVTENFSMAMIAEDFLSLYLSLQHRSEFNES